MHEIETWLKSLRLPQYVANFRENDVSSTVLATLSDQDLKDIGVSSLGHRRLIMLSISKMGDVDAPTTEKALKTTVVAAPSNLQRPLEVDNRPAASAERRHLTVMFCDLVGSTALAATLDPEDMREVVRAYQGVCAQAIGRYEGFVAQYLGDGVMAYFGYPQAHEDDAERAVRAGLDLIAAVAALGVAGLGERGYRAGKIEVRIGIATGLVVVGDLIGEHAAKERAVTGETPNLAARLQGLAAPGSIVVSAATRRLLGGMFDLRDLGPQSLKGLDAPVQAFAVEGLRSFESRFEARAGGLTGFIGREEECEHLLERWRLARQGRGQVVLVSGEAGIGKSRLTAWLVDKIAGEPHTRMRYQCTPHHKDSALYPTIAQIERAAGIEPNEGAEAKLAKLEALLTPGETAAETVPLFAMLLAIPTGETYPPPAMSPGQQRQRTLAALLDQVEALAKQKPLLMIYEDAHWADATSLELLDSLVDRLARLPILLVVTGRPEFSPLWAGRHNVSTVTLQKLDKRHTRAMVESVTGGAALPTEVLDQIVAKTDGVPLFVEELTKTVLESGALMEDGGSLKATAVLPIPATLQDSLMARLDRSNPVKEIAQIGAAIGREFGYRLLLAVAGTDEATVLQGLAKLEEAELATRRGLPPEATYTFKHALVQDAAYESLLKSRRQVIHQRIAQALHDSFLVQTSTEPEVLAHHFTEAGKVTHAMQWWTKAGELALARSAYLEASGHFGRAIVAADAAKTCDTDASRRLLLQQNFSTCLAASQGHHGLETTYAFVRSAKLAVECGDISAHFAARYGVWAGSFCRGEFGKALVLAEQYAEDVEKLEDGPEKSFGQRIVGSSQWAVGRFDQALHHLNSAVKTYNLDRDLPLSARFGLEIGSAALAFLPLVLLPSGDLTNARLYAERAESHASAAGHVYTIAYTKSYLSMYEAMRRDHRRAGSLVRSVIELGREYSINMLSSAGMALLAWVEACEDFDGSSIRRMRSKNDNLQAQNIGLWRTISLFMLADIEKDKYPDAAIANLTSAIDQADSLGECFFNAELWRARAYARLLQCKENRKLAESEFHHAILIARAQHARTFELRASLDLARLYCNTGRESEAVPLLQGALVGFAETPELPEIGEAQRLLASLADG